MWRLFFTNAEINGIDINNYVIPEYVIDGINYHHGDAYDQKVVDSLGFYDIIIDDGWHNLEAQLKFVDLYYDKLLSGGLMIIEDIHTNNIQSVYDKFKSKFNKDPNIVDKRIETGNPDEVIIWAIKNN